MWKWIKRGALGLAVLFGAGLAFAYGTYAQRASKIYTVDVAPVSVPTDVVSVEKGRHLAVIRGCVECHGSDLGGRTFVDDGMAGRLSGANLTSGQGGVGKQLTDLDWVRAIRHGLRRDGTPLLIMPSKEYWHLDDADLGALIAYLKTVPPVDRALPNELGFPLRLISSFNRDIAVFNAEDIAHTARPAVFDPADKISMGKYLATSCTGCHGEGFGGGKIPGAPPDWLASANLTPGGPIKTWSEAQFTDAMRTGRTPDGRALNAQSMPWPVLGQMTDAEFSALFAYLQSLPAKAAGTR
jgi:mono/diheme cytochrome c family protein